MKSTVQPLSQWDESARRSTRSMRRSVGERREQGEEHV